MSRPRIAARRYVLHYTYRAHRHKAPASWTPTNNQGTNNQHPKQ